MVKADTALRRLLRETGKSLGPYGFDGGEPVWVRVSSGGVAAVGRTRVSRTWTGGQQVLRFGLELAATPVAWWEFRRWRDERLGLPVVPLERASGPGLLGAGELADELTTPWSVRVDNGHAVQADIDTVRAELPRRVHAYARRALRLVEPGRYLEELLSLPHRDGRHWEAIVVLLAEQGPSPELDDAFARLRECYADADALVYADELIGYARDRAALV
ncbi:hypothetical protein [Nocardia blacklockiae]|uniref:hypothetical protein n=1 Tax=Nocardia blacklockiae TaxID=480036 RepID=UPI00189599AB|nr:hypothetical protein [Nocardia blacklockiae]MBF6174894.1 hypothetical protein [Nocardia blacklockiae]